MNNRSIKFRVWREDLKRFLDFTESYTLKINPLFSLVYNGNTGHGADISPEKFTQFTGLQDKNDREIYEGDILEPYIFPSKKPSKERFLETVVFEDGAFRVKSNQPEEKMFFRSNLLLDKNIIDSFLFKVVGNIFENPDLLKSNETI